MKLLVLAPFPPRPDAPHGGGRALAGLLNRLVDSHRVALLALRGVDDAPVAAELAARCEFVVEIERVKARSSPANAWRERQRVPMVLTRAPGWAVASSVRAFDAELRRVISRWRPDVVQIEFTVMGQYAGTVAGIAPVLLVEHDPSDATSAMRSFRSRVIRLADAVVTFTERDRAAVAALVPSAQVVCIPLAVVVPPFPFDSVGAASDILFVGNFGHGPNVDAAWRLVTAIFPRIARMRPDARLLLVGPSPPERLRAVASERVVVTGGVDDVAPVLDAAAVIVAPLARGGGMRVKVLEALAAGKAVVASSLAVEGIDVTRGRDVLVEDDDESFAEAVVALLDDDRHRAELGAAARRWAQGHLLWSDVARAYHSLYESLVRRETA
jgi:glycosyltransferase involved in cell wall biosynthesis